MATQHHYRVLLVVPAGRASAFNQWVKANLDPAGGDWITARLSASGEAPFTHGWCSAALTAPEFKLLMERLCAITSITPPADWDERAAGSRIQWLKEQRVPIFTGVGIHIQVMRNDEAWDDPSDALAAVTLTRSTGSTVRSSAK